MKRFLVLNVFLLGSVCFLAGCETVKGIGRDITNTSAGVQGMMEKGNRPTKNLCK